MHIPIVIKYIKVINMIKNDKGTKTIKLAIYFWTDVGEKDKDTGIELPKKTCWDCGTVSAVSNNWHSIRSNVTKPFNSFEELPDAVKDVLKRSGIKMISGKKSKEYKDALKKMKEAELTSN